MCIRDRSKGVMLTQNNLAENATCLDMKIGPHTVILSVLPIHHAYLSLIHISFNAAEQELGSAFDEVKQSFTGNSANQQNAGGQYNLSLIHI